MNLSQRLYDKAQELGVHIGIASAKDYEQIKPLRAYLSFTKTMISVALPITKKDGAIMASFALEEDYHQVLRRKMQELIEVLPECTYQLYVDNGPVDDRLISYLAGMGFQGNNTCIITPGRGSYQLLGDILLDLDLPTNTPSKVSCGTCTRCIDACPVSCLPGDVYENCLVGLLQQKKIYTDEIYQCFETIYGCDICQSVCPFNAKVQTKDSYTYEDLDIREILTANKESFTKFKDTAFYWLGHYVMQRNCIIYAANKHIDIEPYLLNIDCSKDYLASAVDYYQRMRFI